MEDVTSRGEMKLKKEGKGRGTKLAGGGKSQGKREGKRREKGEERDLLMKGGWRDEAVAWRRTDRCDTIWLGCFGSVYVVSFVFSSEGWKGKEKEKYRKVHLKMENQPTFNTSHHIYVTRYTSKNMMSIPHRPYACYMLLSMYKTIV